MVKSSARIYVIRDIWDWNKRHQLNLRPIYQRRNVWNPKYKSYFLDTIIRNLPTSSIHINEKISNSNIILREVVDGQQRLQAILDFLSDSIVISPSHNREFGNIKFSKLPIRIQDRFLDYKLSINVLYDAPDREIFDIFKRLNVNTIRLNHQELRNAAFHGRFKKLVYSLGEENLNYFMKYNVLTRAQIQSMADAELVSELFIAMHIGLQAKRILDKYYEKNDQIYPQESVLKPRFKNNLEDIEGNFGTAMKNGVFQGKTLFYSLYCVIYDFMYGLPGSHPIGSIDKQKCEKAQEVLRHLHGQIKSETPDPPYVDFVKASQKQTDSKKHRRIRHHFLREKLLPFVEK
jgi:hypothetical protein